MNISKNVVAVGGGLALVGLSLVLSFQFSSLKRRIRRYLKNQQLLKPYKKYSRVPTITNYNYNGKGKVDGYLNKYYFYQNSLFSKKERSYYVFVPSEIFSQIKRETVNRKYPLIFVFHGTNGRATRYSSLWQQPDGSLLALAEKEKLILVFGNATAWSESYIPTERRSGWLPGGKDVEYVNKVLDFVIADYPIDTSRIYALGHSNGGMFISELVVSLGHRFTAAVNHMGGLASLPSNADLETRKAWEASKHVTVSSAKCKIPLMIITSRLDANNPPCQRAKLEFEKNGWDVTYICLDEVLHAYWAERTPQVWDFFQKHQQKI